MGVGTVHSVRVPPEKRTRTFEARRPVGRDTARTIRAATIMTLDVLDTRVNCILVAVVSELDGRAFLELIQNCL